MSEQRVGQSTCRICGKPCRPGAGVVLAYGAGGRVHREECLAIAQKVTTIDDRTAGDPKTHARTFQGA
jgi:hypothetical protein